jgi:hypothetical protein
LPAAGFGIILITFASRRLRNFLTFLSLFYFISCSSMIGVRFVAPSPRDNSNKRKSSEIQDGNGGNDDGENNGDDDGDNGDGDNDASSATPKKGKRPPLVGKDKRFYRVSFIFINRTFLN